MREFDSPKPAFAYYAECQLATVERLRLRKNTAKATLSRQEWIAAGMVRDFVKFYGSEVPRHWGCQRLADAILAASKGKD